MRIKVSQYIADFLVKKGVCDLFTVTGGGAMHLNDAFGHKEGLNCIYNHHEQACAMAAEGYARLTGKIAAVCVTSGPGGTNALTGVLGGWQDSIPMMIISGQVKRETTTWSTDIPLRQLGDQEFQIVDCVKTMTKYAYMITDANEIRYHLEKAWHICNTGRKGPVWLDIPLDIQAATVEADTLPGYEEKEKEYPPFFKTENAEAVIHKIYKAKRPVILAGTGIRLSGSHDIFIKMIEKLQVPVLTAWNAHDALEDEHPLFCGRPGTVGTRGGNFIIQKADLLLVLGCRLNIRQIGYNYKEFAKSAYVIMVDIDEAELRKPTIKPDLPIHANVRDVMTAVLQSGAEYNGHRHEEWLSWCKRINEKYPAVLDRYYHDVKVNPYVFMKEFSKFLNSKDVIVCGNGSACVITFQAICIKKGQRVFTNSGCAAMGYGFPASIGCCMARKGERTICIDGDGSFQMNIQELQTVIQNNLNLKIIILNNNGYHSIRQTQTNLFSPPLVGVCKESGISFPATEKIAYAYGLDYMAIHILDDLEKIPQFLERKKPGICEVFVNENQNFEPKISSKVLEDGTIISPEIDDMFPFLPRDEYEEIKNF